MDNNIEAIEKSLALTLRCLLLFHGNAALTLQLEDKILKFEIVLNQLLHVRLAAAPQYLTVVSISHFRQLWLIRHHHHTKLRPRCGHCKIYDGQCKSFVEHLRRYYTISTNVPSVYFNLNTSVVQIVG